jgi:hypothetical protein
MPDTKTIWTKRLISAAIVTLIIVVLCNRIEVQSGVIALVVLAVLPWLSSVIDQMELTGVGKLKFREVEQKVDDQQKQLNIQQEIINKLVVFSMSHYIFEHLSQLYRRNRNGGEYLYHPGAMDHDLQFLIDNGYLQIFNIGELKDRDNLVGRIKLTPVGNFLVELREQLRVQEAAVAAQHLTA